MAGGVFEALAQDFRALLRIASGRNAEPTAAIIDSRTLRSNAGNRAACGIRRSQAKAWLQVPNAIGL